MAKTVSDYKFNNKNLFAIVIAIFGTLSMIILFVTYSQEVEISKELFLKYNSTLPAESKTFEWAFNSLAPFSLIELTILGISTFLFMFALIYVFQGERLAGKQPIGDSLIIGFYFIVFFIFGTLTDPIFLERPINWIWAFAFSIVCGASAHLLLLHERLGRKRRIADTSKFSKSDQRWYFLKQSYEIELSEYRSALHNLIWIAASLGAGLVFSSLLQYTFSLPKEIAFSNPFGSLNVLMFLKVLLLMLGLILGLIYQIAYEIHDIADLIRKQTR